MKHKAKAAHGVHKHALGVCVSARGPEGRRLRLPVHVGMQIMSYRTTSHGEGDRLASHACK